MANKEEAVEQVCKHAGFRMQDGDLVCVSCGEPSKSDKWKSNVYGFNSAEAKAN